MIAKGKVRVTDGCESETLDLPEGADPEEVCDEWLRGDDTQPTEDRDGWTATVAIWGRWETADDSGRTFIQRDPKEPPCAVPLEHEEYSAESYGTWRVRDGHLICERDGETGPRVWEIDDEGSYLPQSLEAEELDEHVPPQAAAMARWEAHHREHGDEHAWCVQWAQSRGVSIVTMERCEGCGLLRRTSTNEPLENGDHYQSVAYKTGPGEDDE